MVRARIHHPPGMAAPVLIARAVERKSMKLYRCNYGILNFPVECFVVPRLEASKAAVSPLLAALNELKQCPTLSEAEINEILLFYGLKSESIDDL